LIYT
jgi:hypothetical protein